MYTLDAIYQATAASPAQYVKNYFERLGELLRGIDAEKLERTIQILEEAIAGGRTIFFIANGGSSAVASHLVNDLVVGAMKEDRPPVRALALTDNTASVTAIGNDAGYEHVFDYQIKMLARPGDVVLAMSVSGNSENIVRGAEQARAMGCATIGWAGFPGSRMERACDLCIGVSASLDEYGPVEDAFSVLGHAMVTWLTMRRGKKLHH